MSVVEPIAYAEPVRMNSAAEPAVPGVTPLLLQYLQIVRRWSWVIAAILAAFLVLGLVVTLLMTPQYTAKARLEIARDEKRVTNVEGLEPATSGQDQEFYSTQYALLETETLARRVARELRLADDPNFFKGHGEDDDSIANPGSSPVQAGNARELRERQVVAMLLDHVTVQPVRGSSLVDVAYTTADREMAAKIANAWVQQFIEASMDRRFESTADARKFLEERLVELRQKLEESERQLVNYATEKGIVSLGRVQGPDGRTQSERTLVAADLEALNSALAEATAARVLAQSKSMVSGLGHEALANSSLTELRQRRAELASEYARTLVQFEPEYPIARQLNEQIRSLDASIAREEGRLRGGRQVDYQQALVREQQLKSQVDELKGQMDTQQRNSIQYNIYQRDADTNRQLYDALLQRYKEIGVAGVGANNIVIVDLAKVPTNPSSPNLLLNLVLALLAGILVAGVATLALEQFDEGLRDPSQVNSALGVPLLGSIPDIDETEGEDLSAALADPKSSLSEAYLSIRSTLAFATDHGVPRSFMVTSTRPAEGKSTTSMALATVLARTGRKMLLIDADMRSPSLHLMTDLTNSAGLSNYLAGEDDWRSMIRQTSTPGLSLMTAGPTPPSAAELLSSDRAANLIRQIGNEFDHVIIDSPPILGLADAPLLSRVVEGSVFVVQAAGVPLRAIKASLGRLTSVRANIFGVVLTKLHHKSDGYGYGYGYGYGKETVT